MYTQNGSSLSLDDKLRLAFHVPTFHSISVLRSSWDVLVGDTSMGTGVDYLGQ